MVPSMASRVVSRAKGSSLGKSGWVTTASSRRTQWELLGRGQCDSGGGRGAPVIKQGAAPCLITHLRAADPNVRFDAPKGSGWTTYQRLPPPPPRPPPPRSPPPPRPPPPPRSP